MKDFQVSSHNLSEFMNDIQSEISEHKLLIVSSQPAGVGKWGMARLWRSWMSKTAEFMACNGVTMPLMFDVSGKPYGKRPFDANDAHELFTRQHLGVDENGLRLSWAKSNSKKINGVRVATKAERFHAMQRHEAWCSERGIILLKPRDSEYAKIQEQHG